MDALNYSTSEINTHQKWIDGKDIYRKVVDLGNLPNTTTKEVIAGLTNVDTVIKLDTMSFDTLGYMSLPYVVLSSDNGFNISVGYTLATDKIWIRTGTNRSAWTGFAILEYTKTS